MEQRTPALKDGQYLSIESPADYETTIKRSRFIASLRYASDRREFDEAHRKITLRYPKATHYCWAYRFAENPILEHASDAGEPAGSAGRPILGALKKYSLLNVMALVSRYYGGVKLGVPGLISAYGDTTALAIQEASIIVREPMQTVKFKCSYGLYNIFLDMLKRHKVASDDVKAIFEEDISGEFKIPVSGFSALEIELSDFRHRGGAFEYFLSVIDH
jgi:uncharacterized YigZ family protein